MHGCLPGFGATASIDLRNYVLEVRARRRYYSFYPQFLVGNGERLRYTARARDAAQRFAGWLPYFNKRWPIGSGKLAFKEFCAANGLPTPRMWRSPSPEMDAFVVKHDNSSFGDLHGPFAAYRAGEPGQALRADGYYEQFIRGRILKAWYWENRLACLEAEDMQSVTGDGKSTARELIAKKISAGTPSWNALSEVLAFQGLSLDSAPASGESVLADIRYGSPLQPPAIESTNVLDRLKASAIVEQLTAFGPALWQGIPEALRPATLYTVDAIADAQERVWLLEMNCNPAVHPDAYPAMFNGLFGAPVGADGREPASMPPPPPASALPIFQPPRPRAAEPPATVSTGRGLRHWEIS